MTLPLKLGLNILKGPNELTQKNLSDPFCFVCKIFFPIHELQPCHRCAKNHQLKLKTCINDLDLRASR